MTGPASLRKNERGGAAVEFAIICPVLVLFIAAIVQLAGVFMADARLGHAVAEGARFATIHPRPTDEQIIARVSAQAKGLKQSALSAPRITHGASDGAEFVDIVMSYSVPINFVMIATPPVTVTETRRAFIYPQAEAPSGQ